MEPSGDFQTPSLHTPPSNAVLNLRNLSNAQAKLKQTSKTCDSNWIKIVNIDNKKKIGTARQLRAKKQYCNFCLRMWARQTISKLWYQISRSHCVLLCYYVFRWDWIEKGQKLYLLSNRKHQKIIWWSGKYSVCPFSIQSHMKT